MRQPCLLLLKLVLEPAVRKEYPEKFTFLWPNRLLEPKIAQVFLKLNLFIDFEDPTPLVRRFLRDDGLRTPSQHRAVMGRQWESRGSMHIPLPGVIRNPGPTLIRRLICQSGEGEGACPLPDPALITKLAKTADMISISSHDFCGEYDLKCPRLNFQRFDKFRLRKERDKEFFFFFIIRQTIFRNRTRKISGCPL
jgi:hypothetical protein